MARVQSMRYLVYLAVVVLCACAGPVSAHQVEHVKRESNSLREYCAMLAMNSCVTCSASAQLERLARLCACDNSYSDQC